MIDNPVLQKRIVEAILFATSEPVSLNEINARLPEGVDTVSIINELKEDYVGRGIEIVERDKSWTFRTANDVGDYLKLEREIPRQLSRAAMETLAIIAYHQPVTRPEIENIRGVAVSKGTLDLLLEEGWVTLGRRREVPGRPVTWKTTREFLDAFGLETLKDLPGLDELKASGLLDTRPAIDIVGGGETADLFDNDDELDDDESSEYDDVEDHVFDDDNFDNKNDDDNVKD